jgi:hypothetical protein
MKLITYATHESGYLQALKESSSNNGFELIILGFNTEWKGLNQKFNDIQTYLSGHSNQNEIVCFVDGFDCIVLGSSDEMLEKYKSRNTDKVLFAADTDSYISTNVYGPINKRDEGQLYNRLNTGCYIGKVKKILELLVELCIYDECSNESNDQELLTLHYNKCVDCLDLDFDRTIFYNLQLDVSVFYWQILIAFNLYSTLKAPLENKYYKLVGDRIVVNNGNYPVILHANGDTNIDLIVEKLGYPVSIKENKDYFTYTIKPSIIKVVEKNQHIAKPLYYLITFIHVLVALYAYVFVYFTDNIFYLSILILFWFLIILQWFLIGNCFLSNIENLLNNNVETLENGKEYTFLLTPLTYFFGENFAYNFTLVYPIFVIIVALYKINKAKCNKNKK